MKKVALNITLREFDFLRHYADLESESFGNAYQSALKAGYSESYARVIAKNYPLLRRRWLKTVLKDEGLMRVIEATRHIDFESPVESEAKVRRIIKKNEEELDGMSAEEVISALDALTKRDI